MSLSPKLIPRYRQELRLRHYARNTIKTYTSILRSYLSWLGDRHPREATDEHIKGFLYGGIERGLSSIGKSKPFR